MFRKILLTLGMLLAASSLRAQAPRPPDCAIQFSFTAASPSVTTGNRAFQFDNRGSGCTVWHLMYTNNGFSALSIEIDEAPDATVSGSSTGTPGTWATWPAADTASGTQPLTVTTQEQITVFEFYPWVSVNLNSVTGNGLVTGTAYGYRPGPLNDANSAPNTVNPNVPGLTDPCQNPNVLKSTKPVSITSATTTSIVAVSGTTAVYVCGGVLTIAPSGTSADTALLEYGTGAACTGPTVLTGTFGNGDLTTAAPPIVIPIGPGLTAPASNGLCILSAGTTVNIQGYISYVQQ